MMFEQLNERVIDLREKMRSKDDLHEHEQQLLDQLTDDLHAYIDGKPHLGESEKLSDRMILASEKFREKHPDLATVLDSTVQILQNMGV